MRRNKRKPGFVVSAFGVLCLAAALVLTCRNLWDDFNAGNKADNIVNQLDNNTKNLEEDIQKMPDYTLNPDMEMPVVTIDGIDYIGTITMESLNIKLPVAADLNYQNLKKTPCRYTGTPYKNDLVIAAHNYTSHFGKLRDLSLNDKVEFIDVEGNVFEYQVAEIEILQPWEVQEMTSSEWDLSLFTCTVSGKSRITVRCVRD